MLPSEPRSDLGSLSRIGAEGFDEGVRGSKRKGRETRVKERALRGCARTRGAVKASEGGREEERERERCKMCSRCERTERGAM